MNIYVTCLVYHHGAEGKNENKRSVFQIEIQNCRKKSEGNRGKEKFEMKTKVRKQTDTL